LIETGVRFLESLATVAQTAQGQTAQGQTAQRGLSSLLTRDPRTNAPVLSIPLPAAVDPDRIMRAITGLLGAFARSG